MKHEEKHRFQRSKTHPEIFCLCNDEHATYRDSTEILQKPILKVQQQKLLIFAHISIELFLNQVLS